MSAAVDLNTRLADLLGIPWRTNDVVSFTLHVRSNQLPQVTIERELMPGSVVCRELAASVEQYTLQPALNLAAMVREAQRTVRAVIERSAAQAKQAVAAGFKQARNEAVERDQVWHRARFWSAFSGLGSFSYVGAAEMLNAWQRDQLRLIDPRKDGEA